MDLEDALAMARDLGSARGIACLLLHEILNIENGISAKETIQQVICRASLSGVIGDDEFLRSKVDEWLSKQEIAA